MELISVVTPCFNEEDNVEEAHRRIKAVFDKLGIANYEHIFIDNASTDGTVPILRRLAKEDPKLKVILNARNFGHIRSPYHGILAGNGDCVIVMASDMQEPPELIEPFLEKWREGYKVVLGVKTQSHESAAMFMVRKFYYNLANSISEIELIKNATGFGLYDREVLEILRKINEPYPYLRGLVSEVGLPIARVEFTQQSRKRGITKNNFFTLYDMAMLGITSHSKLPLRLATMLGFGMSALSMFIALGYLVAKLIFWQNFSLGMAPIVIGIFFFSSVQLFFIGIVGEYVGSIHLHVLNRPLVVEKERINFDPPPEK